MSKPVKVLAWILGGIAALAVLGTAGIAIAARFVEPPTELGVREGRLAACPGTPNCVSTQSDDSRFKMEPIPYTVSTTDAKSRLLDVLQAQPRVTLLSDETTYVHALFRTPTIGFPDDVEFFFDEAARVIHFRSASRMGRGDMGVNRARMEQLSAALRQALR